MNFANWPLYLDQSKDNGRGTCSTLASTSSTKQTGMSVNYRDVINDNEEFFGEIQPLLAGGDDPGWDIIVMTNGRHFTTLVTTGLPPLDPARRPNFDANAAPWRQGPLLRPGQPHGMAWQSGITGIGVNRSR